MNARPRSRFFVDRKFSFANVVRGQPGGSVDSPLMGWRCRACGSWDVFAAVIGEVQDGSGNEQDQQAPSKDGFFEASLSPGKKSNHKDCEGVCSPVGNQFKVLNDMLVNYSSSDGECSPHINSPSASRIPESPLINAGGLDMSVRSPDKGALVYSRRKKFGLEMAEADVRSEPVVMQDQGGQSVLEEELQQTHAQVAVGDTLALPCAFDSEKLGEGSTWVLDRIISFCKRMGLSIEGRELELLSFLGSLEANRLKGDHMVEVSVGNAVVGDSLVPDGANH
uniref:Uncharacterized protein n=1 Tax=Opuntia streptacantha TaxID=393608 RepID=A0A7C9EAQ4_OPUST